MNHLDDDAPDEPIIITEDESDAMIDYYMSQPKTPDEEAAEERMIEVWFPELKAHVEPESPKPSCEKNCRGCKVISCPKEG